MKLNEKLKIPGVRYSGKVIVSSVSVEVDSSVLMKLRFKNMKLGFYFDRKSRIVCDLQKEFNFVNLKDDPSLVPAVTWY